MTRDYVLGIRAALADGSVVDVGGRNLKSVVGYDLVRLLVGSEGTLAVFLKLILRLIPRPARFETSLASLSDAGGRVCSRLTPSSRAGSVPRGPSSTWIGDVLSVVVAGGGRRTLDPRVHSRAPGRVRRRRRAAVREDAVKRAMEVLARAGALEIRTGPDEPPSGTTSGSARRSVSKAVLALAPAKKSEDLGVPRSRLGEAIAAIKAAGAAEGIRVLAYGHAGDANLHVNFLYDPGVGGAARGARPRDRGRAA